MKIRGASNYLNLPAVALYSPLLQSTGVAEADAHDFPAGQSVHAICPKVEYLSVMKQVVSDRYNFVCILVIQKSIRSTHKSENTSFFSKLLLEMN